MAKRKDVTSESEAEIQEHSGPCPGDYVESKIPKVEKPLVDEDGEPIIIAAGALPMVEEKKTEKRKKAQAPKTLGEKISGAVDSLMHPEHKDETLKSEGDARD